MKRILILLIVIVPILVKAGDYEKIRLKSGLVLFDCEVVGFTPTELVISHTNGVDSVIWTQIDSRILEKENFDVEAAKSHADTARENVSAIEPTHLKQYDRFNKNRSNYTVSKRIGRGWFEIETNDTVYYVDEENNSGFSNIRLSYSYSLVSS